MYMQNSGWAAVLPKTHLPKGLQSASLALPLIRPPPPSRVFLQSPHCLSPLQGRSEHSLQTSREDKVLHREGGKGNRRQNVPSAEEEDSSPRACGLCPTTVQERANPTLWAAVPAMAYPSLSKAKERRKQSTGLTLIK